MHKHPASQSAPPQVVGVAWFDREEWRKLCGVAVDGAQLDDTFEEWEANARRMLGKLQSQGIRAEPLHVRVAELQQWCAERDLPIDGSARAQFVSFMLKRKYAGA